MTAKKTDQLPFTEKDLTFWRKEIKDARQKRTDVATEYGWEDNLERYVPKPQKAANGKTSHTEINIGADFRDVERKKAALLFEFPEIGLCVKQDHEIAPSPSPEQPPLMLSTLVGWQAKILNTILGPEHANAEHAARKALFNCLCPSGVGPVAVGYQVTMRKVKTVTPVIDPITQQPVMKPVPALELVGQALGMMQPMPEPLMREIEVEVPIDERWFVSDYSPKALLIPASFRDTNFARAPWLGKDWRKPTSQVRREYGLPKEWTGTADDEAKPHFEHDQANTDDDAGDPYVTGADLYYRKQLRSDEEEHPDALVKLVLVDGKDKPLAHVVCPYQTFDEQGGLTKDSLKTFVDKPLVLRDLTDSAYVPSDSTVTGALTKEINKYRTQSVEAREGNKQVIAFDSGKMDPTAIDKIKTSNGVVWVPLQEGALAAGKDTIMVQVAQPSLGRENWLGQDYIERDREQILGIGANQTGTQAKGKRTATEIDNVQRNSEARFEQERKRVTAWVIDVAAAIDVLILRYADARIAVDILGEVRGKLWAQYKKALVGQYNYELQIDSGKYLDVEADRRQTLQFYNIVRKDPLVNPRPILKKLASKFDYDPAEFVVEPPKPDKELKASISIKGEDLNPLSPAFAIMVSLARQGGWNISEDDVKLAQQQAAGMTIVSGVGANQNPNAKKPQDHPGAADKAPTINQHVSDESGARSGPKVAGGSVM